MAGTMVSGTCTSSRETKEEKVGMYPPEWWWAERQVSEVLAENPGELVKTGAVAAIDDTIASKYFGLVDIYY